MNREQKIDYCIKDWMNSIRDGGPEQVRHILQKGFVGYENMSDEDLDREYNTMSEND